MANALKRPGRTAPATMDFGRLSSESVRAATGRGWEEWVEVLDRAGAADWSHKEIVAHLARAHPEVKNAWWRQSVTVGYERARGRRLEGETVDGGFQVGVQRSLPATAAALWKLLTERPELWLGEGASVAFSAGERYTVPRRRGDPGAVGEVRVVKPGERLRMMFQPGGWPTPAVLQLTLTRAGTGKTALVVALERLPDAAAREAMRVRFREALDRIAAPISAPAPRNSAHRSASARAATARPRPPTPRRPRRTRTPRS